MNRIADILKWPAHATHSRIKAWNLRRFYKKLSVKEAFSEIYRSQMWGKRDGAASCSGEGSSREDIVRPYCDEVQKFIHSHEIHDIVDLGCGDFNVGSRLHGHAQNYTAIDVVPELIDYNRQRFSDTKVKFECLNIIEEALPQGDLCLIRQVLQHLSNAQITGILKKLEIYKFVIVTEHVYQGHDLQPNLDKPQGPGTRIPKHSGVFVDAPPFNKTAKLLLEIPIARNELLRTVIVERTH